MTSKRVELITRHGQPGRLKTVLARCLGPLSIFESERREVGESQLAIEFELKNLHRLMCNLGRLPSALIVIRRLQTTTQFEFKFEFIIAGVTEFIIAGVTLEVYSWRASPG